MADRGAEISTASRALERLLGIIVRLRSPDGCLWDRGQKKEDVRRYLIEEAYEVVEAIDKGKPQDLREELGDLLFQILFLARIAEEQGEFDVTAVLDDIAEKMVRRHPHVFGGKKVKDVEEIRANWEDIKRRVELKEDRRKSILDAVPGALPALLRAQRISEEAAKVGFDWQDREGVLGKVEEELAEFKTALAADDKDRVREELGDLLFALVNLGRFAGIAAEDALRSSTAKFMDRFSHIEARLKEMGKGFDESSLAEMDRLWDEAKSREKEKNGD